MQTFIDMNFLIVIPTKNEEESHQHKQISHLRSSGSKWQVSKWQNKLTTDFSVMQLFLQLINWFFSFFK